MAMLHKHQETLAQARSHHQSGNLQLAEQMYQQVLRDEPANADALHYYGILCNQKGQPALAVSLLQKSLTANPGNAVCHSNLGAAYHALGQLGEAEACFRAALGLQPDLRAAQENLTTVLLQERPLPDVSAQNRLACDLIAAGKLDEARTVLETALRDNANAEETYRHLGQVARRQKRLQEADDYERRAFFKEIVNGAFLHGMDQIRAEIEPLVALVHELNPRHLLEIGSYKGGTFYIWCKLQRLPGKKISLDLAGLEFGGISEEQTAQRNARMATWSDQVYCLNANSHAPATLAAVKQILNGDQLDFLFIDGDHTYDGVKLDYSMYGALVREGGYIAFHDINETRREDIQVARLWRELRGEKIEYTMHTSWGCGIGIIRKKA